MDLISHTFFGLSGITDEEIKMNIKTRLENEAVCDDEESEVLNWYNNSDIGNLCNINICLRELLCLVIENLVIEEDGDIPMHTVLETWDISKILLPNILVGLAICFRQRVSVSEVNLSKLVSSTSGNTSPKGWNYEDFSRSLPKVPKWICALFGVEKAEDGKPYTIRTHYPQLLASIIKGVGHSPFASSPGTARSYTYNESFFRDCLPQGIARKQTLNLEELEHFYLLERLFRLDMKRFLFSSYTLEQGKTLALSLQLIADLIFHSPIVLQPVPEFWRDGLLGTVGDHFADEDFRTAFVHLLLRIETQIFPWCLQIMYSKLLSFDLANLLEHLEHSIDRLGFNQPIWQLPQVSDPGRQKKRNLFPEALAYFPVQDQFNLELYALRSERVVTNTNHYHSDLTSGEIYQHALNWFY